MANTNSWKFPNMFNITQNTVALVNDEESVANRGRLLLLTEPTELYNEPQFGVGLRRYLWQYNNENTRAMMRDRIREQFRINEPCIDADAMEFIDTDPALSEDDDRFGYTPQDYNKVEMTVELTTTFGGSANIVLDDELVRWIDNSAYTDTDALALKSNL